MSHLSLTHRVRRDVFNDVGGYDQTLSYSENQDLGLRLVDYFLSSRDEGIAHVTEVVVEIHREPGTARSKRYKSAPADAARVLLSRYADRLVGDPSAHASLLRVVARGERHDRRFGPAVSAALLACRLQPLSLQNYRSLGLALMAGLWGTAVRFARTAPPRRRGRS